MTASSLALVGCQRPAASLIVDLRTDYGPGIEFTTVRVEVDGQSQTQIADSNARYSDGVRVAEFDPSNGIRTGSQLISVVLETAAGTVLARQQTLVELAEATAVTVLITRSCAGVECPSDDPALEACVGGRCEDVRCTVETPEFCQRAPECERDSDCGADSACGSVRCSAGDCIVELDHSVCTAGQWCDPTVGCTTASTSPLCNPIRDADTVALYTFDSDLGRDRLTDETGAHEGTAIPSLLSWPAVRAGCGWGLRARSSPASTLYAHIDHSPDFDLSGGSIDLWVRLVGPTEACQSPLGCALITRDANHTERPGHITLGITREQRVHLRIQNADGMTRLAPRTPLEMGQLIHVGVNFGEPVELWIDGELVTEFYTQRRSGTGGIAGNENPWTLLSHSRQSPEGELPPQREVEDEVPATSASVIIDHVRISRVRRDFSAYAAGGS